MAKEEIVKSEAVTPEVLPDYSTFGLPQVSDPFAKLQLQLSVSSVETWDFEAEGDVMGLVLAKQDRFHEEFGRYPYITIQLPDGSMRGVAGVGYLLTSAFDRANEGDLIAITKQGKQTNRAGTREYNAYGVATIPAGQHNVGVQGEKPF